nr:hypothetical protein Iba_chr04fCG0420 [Ipomoea batatas]
MDRISCLAAAKTANKAVGNVRARLEILVEMCEGVEKLRRDWGLVGVNCFDLVSMAKKAKRRVFAGALLRISAEDIARANSLTGDGGDSETAGDLARPWFQVRVIGSDHGIPYN